MVEPAREQVRAAHGATESLFDLAQAIVRQVPAVLGDRVELLSLELQRAGAALARMLVLTVVAAIFALTAWLALWGVLVGVLTALGWPPVAVHITVVLVNAAAAAWAIWRARRMSTLLGLPATRRHLTPQLHEPITGAALRQEVADERHPAAAGSVAAP